jgi:hypothetical protein
MQWTGHARIVLLSDPEHDGEAHIYTWDDRILASPYAEATVTDYPVSTDFQRRIEFVTHDLATLPMAFVANENLGSASAAVIVFKAMAAPDEEATAEHYSAPSTLIFGAISDATIEHVHDEDTGEHTVTVVFGVDEAHGDVDTPWGSVDQGAYAALV